MFGDTFTIHTGLIVATICIFFSDFGASILLFLLTLYNIRNLVKAKDVKMKIAHGMISLTMA